MSERCSGIGWQIDAMKTYIFIRRDLKMRRGKEIAQACHAVLNLGVPDGPIITFQCDDLDSLAHVAIEAGLNGWHHYIVRDAGRTEVEPGTETCIAVHAPDGVYPEWMLY